jgi:hypothetical protein
MEEFSSIVPEDIKTFDPEYQRLLFSSHVYFSLYPSLENQDVSPIVKYVIDDRDRG